MSGHDDEPQCNVGGPWGYRSLVHPTIWVTGARHRGTVHSNAKIRGRTANPNVEKLPFAIADWLRPDLRKKAGWRLIARLREIWDLVVFVTTLIIKPAATQVTRGYTSGQGEQPPNIT